MTAFHRRLLVLPLSLALLSCGGLAAAKDTVKIAFIGPHPEVIRLMGNKVRAREAAKAAGLPLLPGSPGVLKSAEEAIATIKADPSFDLVLTDMAMPDAGAGLKVLTASREVMPDTPVLVVTAYGNIEGALDTIQQGAQEAVNNMQAVVARVDLGVQHGQHAGEAVRQIRSSAAQVLQMVGEITAAIQHQNDASSAINNEVDKLAHRSQQISSAANHGTRFTVEMQQTAEEMGRIVARFRLAGPVAGSKGQSH